MAHYVQVDGKVHGVVAAIADEAGRWLCIRRSANVPAPLQICFPGGGVDEGESLEQAVVREIREELGIEIEPIDLVWTWDHPNGRLRLHGFTACWIGGQITPSEHEIAEVFWMDGETCASHPDAMPSCRDLVDALARWESQHRTEQSTNP
jgi:mutator protein MutT